MSDTQGHMLVMLPKADPGAKTWSGKCKANDARYNAGTEDDVQAQHLSHLRDLGLIAADPDAEYPEDGAAMEYFEPEPIDPPVDPDMLGEFHGNEREQTEG